MKDKSILTVDLKANGLRPYSKDAPVHELYSSLNPILGQLLYVDQKYDLKAGLLKSFKWEHKKKAYVLEIPHDLRFHNGRKVTAKDLEFSLLRGFFTSKRSFRRAFFNNIDGIDSIKESKKFKTGSVKGIKVVSEYKVEIRLKKPDPSFLYSLNRPSCSLVPMEELEEANYEVWKKFPIGAGSYKVIHVKAKDEMILEKASTEVKGPDFIKINFSGKDKKSDIKLNEFQKNNLYETAFSEKTKSVTNIFFNFNSPLGSNISFRKALHYAINREELVKNNPVFKETQQFLASHFWGRIETPKDDSPEKAKSLLKDIENLSKSFPLKIPIFGRSSGSGILTDYVKTLKKQLSEVGLQVEFFESKDKYFSKTDKETPFRVISLGADVADPLILFEIMNGGDSSPLWPHFPKNDNKYINLIDIAREAETLKEKTSAVREISKYFYNNKISVPLFERKQFVSFRKDRIKSIGEQNGGLTFYLNRVSIHGEE